jgi:NodT family efflux transporter outer membrane factor (OMF) lipoprotein
MLESGPGGLCGPRAVLRKTSLVFMALLIPACSAGPDYRRPAAPVPASYKEDWKVAQPRDDFLRGKWWEVFNDPQLNALEEQVEVSNQNLAAAEAQFRVARSGIRAARAELFPTLTGGGSVARSRSSSNRSFDTQGFSLGTTNDYRLPLDFSYEVDVWGRVRRNIEANLENTRASAAELETLRLSTHAEVALDYFQLRGLDQTKQLLDSTVLAYQKALELTTNRYNQGIATQVDVAQARTQLESTRAQSTELGVARAQFEHAIAVLSGKPPAELTLAPGGLSGAPPAIPAGLPSELLERRPDIAAAERRVAAANARIGVARAAYFPTVSLSAAGGLEASTVQKLFTWSSRFWSLGATVSETVFDGGRRRAATESAEASYDATVAGYRQSVLAAFQAVEDNLAELRILAEETAQQAGAVEAAERSLALTTNRYQGGIATYLEVIVAQTAALTTRRTAVDLQTRRMTGSVLLVKALGGGWRASDLWGSPSASKEGEKR